MANVGQAKAALKEAADNLDYTKVLSPIHGKVSRRLIDVGNMVKANETQLTYVYAIDPMYGYFDVDERAVIRIRKLINEGKMPHYRQGKIQVKVGLADEEGFSLIGEIDYVDQVLDAGTGTLKIRCVIRQPRTREWMPHTIFSLPGGHCVSGLLPTGKPLVLVSPGMFIRVRLPIGVPERSLLIAERAVGTEQGKKFVNVIGADNKVARVYVELGQMHYGLRVVKAVPGMKLERADKLAVTNLQRLAPGKEVIPTVVAMPQYTPPDAPAVAGAPHGSGQKAG
jgi:multidrug efflux pump subunit AcrA (membrane-fusion protein)